MESTKEIQSKVTFVRLKGKATIQSINLVRTALLNAIERDRPIRIDVEHVTEVDLSFIQVLISIAYTCTKKTIDIAVVNAGLEHPLRLYVEKLGFRKIRFL